MNPSLQQLFAQLVGGWRFRWEAIAVATLAALVGWGVVFSMPDRFEAETQVLVDSRTALKPALQGLTNDQDVGVQLSYVQQSLLVDAQLCRIVNAAGMLPECAVDPGSAQIPLAQIRKRIHVNARRYTKLIDRMIDGVLTKTRRDDFYRETRPIGMNGGDIGDGAQIKRMGASSAPNPKARVFLAHAVNQSASGIRRGFPGATLHAPSESVRNS